MKITARRVPPMVGTKRRENTVLSKAAARTDSSSSPVPGVLALSRDAIRMLENAAQNPEKMYVQTT
jgi:hypothetical protein